MEIAEQVEFIGGTDFLLTGRGLNFSLEGKEVYAVAHNSMTHGYYTAVYLNREDGFCVEGKLAEVIMQLPSIIRSKYV